ncbi:MAG: arginine--tRNA ligase [Bacteroidetes bacterium]|nr:MAG: arginine--tRNA ligase [Bacteroidota bacterium]
MNIENTLKQKVAEALQTLFGLQDQPITLQSTLKDFEGSHTLLVFPYTKPLQRKPEEIAQAIGDYLVANAGIVTKYNVVKGFLNLSLSEEAWLASFQMMRKNPAFGTFPDKRKKVMVEFSSPNTNKPLHLGHLRNNFLGWSVAQILSACGYEVIKANLINDRGIHICKSMLAYQKFGKGETPSSSGLKGDHLVGKYYVEFDKLYKAQIKELEAQGMGKEEAEKKAPAIEEAQKMLLAWEKGDKEVVALWKKMNDWVYGGFAETYQKIGVSFDKIYYESNTYKLGKNIVQEGLKKGVFYQKPDGAVCIDLTADGLDNKVVQRGDGTSVYITQDMGTADLKYQDFHIDKSVYVVGNEQDYHFKVLFNIMKKMGRSYAEGMYHVSYGMVELPNGKMKSREGTVVDADELVDEMIRIAEEKTTELGKMDSLKPEELPHLYQIIALGALKYFLLKVDPKKKMLFNPEESVNFQGDAAPFIQYNHARICSILRKAEQDKISYNLPESYAEYKTLHSSEIDLLSVLLALPTKVQEAGEAYSPSILAQYSYEVAKGYSKFFADCSIFKADTDEARNFRIALSAQTAYTLKFVLKLLGIEVPDKM